MANDYEMSLNAVSKHIKVLEKSGLVHRKKTGRVHLIEADISNIKAISSWIDELRSIWESRLDTLNEILKNGEHNND